MKQVIDICGEGRSHSRILVGDVLADLPACLKGRHTIVITDSNIHRLHREAIEQYEHVIVGLGETNKTLRTVEKLYSTLLEMNADRECFILGFGGGIVTDLAGFTASTFMRGLPFGFVATTLLAQVDASVGGKNGVNVEGYKNMAGTFDQPEFVLCDTALLRTLPEREFRAGIAEMAKAAVIADPGLFSLLENHTHAELASDPEVISQAVSAAIKVKAAIVERDEKEKGERRKLNLGHTIAHAIEKTDPSSLHGEAVSVGLATAAKYAVKTGRLDEGSAGRIEALLRSFGLPTELPPDTKRLAKAMRYDKKRNGDIIMYPIPTGIGSCEIIPLELDRLEEVLGI